MSQSLHISLPLTAGRVAHNSDSLMEFLYFLLMNLLYAVVLPKVPVTLHFPFWCAGASPGKSNIIISRDTTVMIAWDHIVATPALLCHKDTAQGTGSLWHKGGFHVGKESSISAHLTSPSPHQTPESRRRCLVVPGPEMKVSRWRWRWRWRWRERAVAPPGLSISLISILIKLTRVDCL